MKVALSLEVSDAQRNALARAIAGKDLKRLATREEVKAFVEGCVASLSYSPVDSGTPGVAGEDVVKKLRGEGKSESYIRGWLAAGSKK